MSSVAAYLILTHGPRKSASLSAHPAARQQVANLKHYFQQRSVQIVWHHDYARKHETLADLPRLEELLGQLAETEKGALVMDDLGRLFRNVPQDRRVGFLEELQSAGARIFGLRQGTELGKLSRDKLLLLLAGGGSQPYVLERPPRRARSKQELHEQTEMAHLASQVARKKQADAFAVKIAALRDEISGDQQTPTLREIAEAGNARGVNSTRGNKLTPATVSRALKRADDLSAARDPGTLADRARRLRQT